MIRLRQGCLISSHSREPFVHGQKHYDSDRDALRKQETIRNLERAVIVKLFWKMIQTLLESKELSGELERADKARILQEVSRSKSRKERHHRRRRRSSGERGERRASRDPKMNSILQRLIASTKMRQKATQTDDATLLPVRTALQGFLDLWI